MKAYAIGINHVALEVGDIEEALKFYGDFLKFEVHEKNEMQAFIYFGDQFINFIKSDNKQPDQKRHFGIAVDNKELVRQTLEHMGVKLLEALFLIFLIRGEIEWRSLPMVIFNIQKLIIYCRVWGLAICEKLSKRWPN